MESMLRATRFPRVVTAIHEATPCPKVKSATEKAKASLPSLF
jgi:hypothetical protein